MTKKYSTKKALVASVLMLALCFSMLIGTTFAWFTDSVTSANNIIKSGTLDVELYYQAEGQTDWTKVTETTNVFKENALWEPGHTEVVKLKVVNEGNLALKYNLGVNVASEIGSVNIAGKDFLLSDFIKFGIVDGAQSYTRDQAIAAVDATATALKTAYNSGTTALEAKNDGNTDEKIVTMVVYMPTSVGNDANAKTGAATPTINLGINLIATQMTAEEDSFNNQYDKDAIIATTAAEAQAALDSAGAGATIRLAPGVNYGTLYLRPVAGSVATKEIDWIGNNYRYETYSLFEDLTIVGAPGAIVDVIKIEGGTYYNNAHSQSDTYPIMLSLIELKNVVIDGVTFTGNGGQYGDSHGNAISLAGNNIKVDGLTIKNCVLEDPTNNNRLLYKSESTTHVHTYEYDGETFTFTPSLKDIVVTDCTFNGGYHGLELRETKNVTITNNVFNVGDRNILLATNSGCTYTGNVTITGNVSNNAKERFVRMSGAGAANVVIKDNTITNYLGKDADYIKVTDSTGTPVIENNTLVSIGVKDAAAAQAALDKAVAGTTIQLQPGVNYGTLVFGQNASNKVVDISAIGGDETGNERYSRYENITILGAAGATVDQITFDIGREDANTIWNYIDVKNLTIKNVTFSGASTAVWIPDGFDIAIDGLSLVNCKMTDTEGNDRFVYQPRSGYKTLNDKTTGEYVMTSGVKNLTITGCEITGAHQVIESRAMENLTITNNIFKGIKQRDMLITSDTKNNPNVTYTGTITITGNTSIGGEERFVRASLNNSDVAVIIKDNTIINYMGKDADYIKVTDFNRTPVIENNTLVSIGVKNAAALQAALDNAVEGTTIQLQPGVNYGTVYLRATENNVTSVTCFPGVCGETYSDVDAFKAHWANENTGGGGHVPYYTAAIKNVTIVGADGATVAGVQAFSGHASAGTTDAVLGNANTGSYYVTLNISNLTFKDVAFTGQVNIDSSNEDAIYDGVTFDGCSFTTGGTAQTNGAAIRYYSEANNGNVKNIVVKDCEFNNCRQGVYTHHVNGVTVTGSAFDTLGHNAIAVQSHSSAAHGNVTITGNTFKNVEDRVIRFNGVNAPTAITIQNNTATNCGDDSNEVMKATSIASGVTTSISGNNWGAGKVVANDELKDK